MKKFEDAFQQRLKDKEGERGRHLAEIAEHDRIKAEEKAKELAADKCYNPKMPMGMEVSPEERQRRIQEMLQAFDDDQASKKAQKADEKAQNQKMREEALKALEAAREEAEKRR